MEKMEKNTELVNKVIAYFKENEDEFIECIEDLDGYNGYLGDDRYYSMDELDEFYSNTEPSEILYRAFYGHDDDTYTTDGSGNREYGQFNPNREYFRFNAYGNLVSSNYKDYSEYLDEGFVDELHDNLGNLYSVPDAVSEMFDEFDSEEAE